MGYFDDAKASREEENTLEHSSGPWKKHKYIQKIGEGANAVYKYAKKKVDTDITGKDYKKEATDQKIKAREANTAANYSRTADPEYYVGGQDAMNKQTEKFASKAEYHGRKAAEAESAYYTKSLAGKSKATVDKGKALIKDFFTPKTKVTASSNLTGKETINTKPAEKVTLKKNKLSFKKN